MCNNKDEIEITSVEDFIKTLDDINTVYNSDAKCCFEIKSGYFRGQASKRWDVSAGIFRNNIDEISLYTKAFSIAWKELTDCSTYLEKLVKLQHYRLKTRLLDITFNPLVALYFACEEVDNNSNIEDGVVYWGYKLTQNTSLDIAEFGLNFLIKNGDKHIFPSVTLSGISCSKLAALTTPQLVLSPLNNNRIEAQNGAFIMHPVLKKTQDIYVSNFEQRNSLKNCFEKQYIIPQQYKKGIIRTLNIIGINKASLFPELEYKLQHLNNKFAIEKSLNI